MTVRGSRRLRLSLSNTKVIYVICYDRQSFWIVCHLYNLSELVVRKVSCLDRYGLISETVFSFSVFR